MSTRGSVGSASRLTLPGNSRLALLGERRGQLRDASRLHVVPRATTMTGKRAVLCEACAVTIALVESTSRDAEQFCSHAKHIADRCDLGETT